MRSYDWNAFMHGNRVVVVRESEFCSGFIQEAWLYDIEPEDIHEIVRHNVWGYELIICSYKNPELLNNISITYSEPTQCTCGFGLGKSNCVCRYKETITCDVETVYYYSEHYLEKNYRDKVILGQYREAEKEGFINRCPKCNSVKTMHLSDDGMMKVWYNSCTICEHKWDKEGEYNV